RGRRTVVVLLPRQHLDELVVEAPGRLEIADAPFVRTQVRELRRFGDCLLHAAEAVDEADLVCGSAVPDTPLGNLVDLLRRLVPRGADDAEEACVYRLDAGLNQFAGLGRGPLEQVGFV